MSKIKYDSEIIRLITLFESMTGAKVRDCISNEKILFIIEENEMGKAIGKNGSNIKRMEKALKRKIKLAEFSSDVTQFVRNLAHPVGITGVKNQDGVIIIHGADSNSRAMLIGRERQNLSHMTGIIKRYFDVKEVKVL